MKLIDNNFINKILYRYPKYNIKNLGIYNNSTSNKILFHDNAEIYILKPKGKKAFLWFTYIKSKMICILIFINNNNLYDNSNQYYEVNIDYDDELCYNNVLLFGYYLHYKSEQYFIIENVYNYNKLNTLIGDEYYNHKITNKLYIIENVLNKVKNYVNNANNVNNVNNVNNANNVNKTNNVHKSNILNINLPVITNKDNLYKILNSIDYSIYSIHVYSKDKYLGNFVINTILSNDKNNRSNIRVTFKVTASLNNDIYNLYILNNNNEEFYDYALIDTYKRSKFMNSLFRTIKENENIDYIEESEDEEYFENIDKNKYLLNKCYNLECMYNNKFKKWVPLKISENSIINKNNLFKFIKK